MENFSILDIKNEDVLKYGRVQEDSDQPNTQVSSCMSF